MPRAPFRTAPHPAVLPIRLMVGSLLLLLLGVACAGTRGSAVPSPPGPPLAGHVVLVSVDGLRPDAITASATPTLHRLASEGRWTFRASTVFPSTTLPAHVSMLTGMTPDAHGVTSNLDLVPLEGYAPFPTVFSLAGTRGLSTAAFLGKTKLRYLSRPGTLDHVSLPENPVGMEPAAETMRKALDFLRSNRPRLLFVHLGDPDYAGHQSGWMSARYAEAVRTIDAHVERLIAAADSSLGPGSYAVLVTADHGGQSHNHGSAAELDVAIPWIIWGRGVASRGELSSPVRTVDTAPTVLRLLGLPPPPGMSGSPIEEVLASP